MDWFDLTQPHETHVYMVSQSSPDSVIGELEGVDLGGSSINADWDNDNRTSGKLRVVGGNWVRGSFLRIVVSYPEWERTLGTYIVTNDPATKENGEWVYDLELQSMIWALEQEKDVQQWTLATGASSLEAASQMLAYCGRLHRIQGSDCAVASPVLYESGTSFRERLYDLCSMGGNRLDVDGMGYVTVYPDIPVSQKAASFEIDLSATDGIAMDGAQRSTDYLEAPGRVAVAYRWSETEDGESVNHEVVGFADATGFASRAQRGYMVTDFRVVSELDPPTQQQAQYEAQRILLEEGGEHVTWQLSTMFLPIWEGDAVALVVNDGDERYRGRRHCLVKSVEVELQHLTMRLTLTEA